MKKIAFPLIWIVVALTVSRCCTTPDLIAETKIALLKADGDVWIISSVTADEVDVTDVFKGMTFQFDDTSYSTTHGGTVWPPSGKWNFIDDSAERIARTEVSDGYPPLADIKVDVTETTLILSFPYPLDTVGVIGRGQSVAGNYVFNFKRA